MERWGDGEGQRWGRAEMLGSFGEGGDGEIRRRGDAEGEIV